MLFESFSSLYITNFVHSVLTFRSDSVRLCLLCLEFTLSLRLCRLCISGIFELSFDHLELISQHLSAVRLRCGNEKAPLLLLDRLVGRLELVLQLLLVLLIPLVQLSDVI